MTREQRDLKPEHRQRPGRGSHRLRFGMLLHALIMAGMSAAALPAAAAETPAVVTTTGAFKPVPSPTEAGVNVFFGLRYAAPPVGALRWAPPQTPAAATGTIVAAAPGDACPQTQSTAPLAQSEDCLFLNVYVPASATPNSNLPVFFWIHGGALIFGTGAQYDPSVMVADGNMIAVTINYRLGALGWLVEPGLEAASANAFQNVGDAGNYGLMDQQFALQWVQQNIAAFGGDPTKVTVAGESAGGLSISSLLASTEIGGGLFRGAILESGGYMLHSVPTETTYGTRFGPGFDSALGCTQPADAACLRSQSVAGVMDAQNKVFGQAGISPNSGTRILPLGLQQAFSTGQIIRVPVLQGSNANEGRLFEPGEIPFSASLAAVAAAGGPANLDLSMPNSFCATPQFTGTPAVCTYQQELNLYLAGLGIPAFVNTATFDSAIAAEYPLANFPDPFLAGNAPSADEALAQIFTDLVFACNVLDSNTELARWVPVFAYEFNDPAAPAGAQVIEAPNDQFGYPTASEHASELQFLFDFGSPLNQGEQRLAVEMKDYWENFTISGNPNFGTNRFFFAPWLPFNLAHAIQNLVPGPSVPRPFFTFPSEHFCSTWEPFIAAE
jgi:para-nitrobenzyl esterase